ncbi:hypothetical protein FA15DRAFT_658973 [Coprinopsis marcescibilis]|uniref:Uncharacterized protein n=1 Tax=Coprinopsis marcescibilis TaxID=230819 RepID=A0A5C3KJS4_COPMA|nr:hypothetical protein FA15DRAFT_658973 [Coprinopsis marcescibilis]
MSGTSTHGSINTAGAGAAANSTTSAPGGARDIDRGGEPRSPTLTSESHLPQAATSENSSMLVKSLLDSHWNPNRFNPSHWNPSHQQQVPEQEQAQEQAEGSQADDPAIFPAERISVSGIDFCLSSIPATGGTSYHDKELRKSRAKARATNESDSRQKEKSMTPGYASRPASEDQNGTAARWYHWDVWSLGLYSFALLTQLVFSLLPGLMGFRATAVRLRVGLCDSNTPSVLVDDPQSELLKVAACVAVGSQR